MSTSRSRSTSASHGAGSLADRFGDRTGCRGGSAAARPRVATGMLGALLVLCVLSPWPGRCRGQETKPGAAAAAAAAEPRESIEPLSLRYRFIETYGVAENPAKPELIVGYQVGSLETFKTEIEKAQGAPARSEGTIQTIYTERPARVSKLGELTDSVRRYDLVRAGGSLQTAPTNPPVLQGLSLWYHPRGSKPPEIVSLTEGRVLREREHHVIVNQIFLPQLKAVLPMSPTRVGDSWKLSPAAAQALLRRLPDGDDDDGELQLEANLSGVHRSADGKTLTASIEVSGELELDQSRRAVKARVHFAFEPPEERPAPASAASSKATVDPSIIDARGWIARVQMGRVLSEPIDDNSRLRQISTRELNLVRRRPSAAAAGDRAALIVPDVPPIANEANSWLLYEDAKGRFHFRHPQELTLQMSEGRMENPDSLEFLNKTPTATDALAIAIVPKETDPARNRQNLDPDDHLRKLRATWREMRQDVVEGEAGWLPDKDWAPRNRRVHRLEAALKQSNPKSPRVYYNYYLVLFPRDASIVVTAMTERNDHFAFRNQVESAIKSFDFGPVAATVPSEPPTRQ